MQGRQTRDGTELRRLSNGVGAPRANIGTLDEIESRAVQLVWPHLVLAGCDPAPGLETAPHKTSTQPRQGLQRNADIPSVRQPTPRTRARARWCSRSSRTAAAVRWFAGRNWSLAGATCARHCASGSSHAARFRPVCKGRMPQRVRGHAPRARHRHAAH